MTKVAKRNTILTILIILNLSLTVYIINTTEANKHHIQDGNVNVAVIYLCNAVEYNLNATTKIEQQLEVESSPDYYSVKSFYEFYNIHLSFDYFSFNISDISSHDAGGSYRDRLIVNEFIQNYTGDFTSLYAAYDHLMFFIDTVDSGLAWSGGGISVIDMNFMFDSRTFLSIPGYLSGVAAHELAHAFGADDHYSTNFSGTGNGLGDNNCLMNQMGNDSRQLLHTTVFGPIDLNDNLHFDYLVKYNVDFFLKNGVTIP